MHPALQKQNMQESDIKPGDGIFFNTGWGSLWKKNNDKFNSGEPGIGLEVANWVNREGSLPDRCRYPVSYTHLSLAP